MQVLVVDAYERSDTHEQLGSTTAAVLEQIGHTVTRLHLHDLGFEEPMSAAERSAYDSGSPLVTTATQDSATAVKAADALVFCYPTTMFGVPAVLKSWLERVLVEGVSFTFDHNNRLRPALTNVRRLATVTTTPHSPAATRRARNTGHRTIMWTIRLNCHKRCRRTTVRLDDGASQVEASASVTSAFARWRP